MASCACGLTWRMIRRASQMATGTHLIGGRNKALQQVRWCAMTSGSPNIAQPSPNRSVRGVKLSSVIVLVDCSIAIDPIKYIGIPFSFDDFKPDSNIIDNDGMPGKPSVPACSVFGSYSHFMILSFGSRMKRTEEPRAGDRPDQVVSWVSFRSDHP
jgi:hypothetical protein